MRPAKRVFSPLDDQLDILDKHWSQQVAKQSVWLSGLVPFEQAEKILRNIGQIEMSASSVWRRVDKWGQRFQAVEAAHRAQRTALPPRSEIVAGEAPDEQKRMGVAIDGAIVYIREEGWKELKVGCIFDIEMRPTFDKHIRETVDLAHAIHNSYVAHLGGPEVLGELVWGEACRRNWTQACDTQALGDGAVWVWNVVAQHFYDSRQAVDWYHATQHLARASHLLKGEDTPAAQKWFRKRETLLYEGQAEQIATELFQATPSYPSGADELRREAGYFQNNHRRMQYLELREDNFAIGSGMVESGCKQFRARLCGPGMRWSREGIERLLPVRAAIMSNRFDSLWQAAYSPPLN